MKVNNINRVYGSVNNPSDQIKRERFLNETKKSKEDTFEKVLREEDASQKEYDKAKKNFKKQAPVDEEYLKWAYDNRFAVSIPLDLPDSKNLKINSVIDFEKIPNIYHFINKFYDINYSTPKEIFEIGSFLIDTEEIQYDEFMDNIKALLEKIGKVTGFDLIDGEKANSMRVSWIGVLKEYIHSYNKVGNSKEEERYKNMLSIFKNIENSKVTNVNLNLMNRLNIKKP